MTAPESPRDGHAVLLADLRSLAAAERWDGVTAFLDGLPSEPDGAVLALLGQDVAAEPLLRALTATAGPATVRPLLAAVAEPDRTLAADRTLVIFRCGQLISLEEAEAARTVTQRPAGSCLVVFVGAERLTDPDELELVQRAAWRVLLAGPTEDWRGQDLAGRACLLWAAQPGTGFLAGRLARDAALLRDWLASPAADRPLAVARAARALDLADEALAAKAHDPARGPARPAGDAQRAGQLRTAAAAVARRIGNQLQAAGRSLDSELSASLDMAREDLRAGVAAHLKTQCRDLGSRSAVNACLVAYLETEMRRWHSGPYRVAVGRAEQAFAAAEQQLEDVEWGTVDRILPPRPGGHTYGEAAADALRLGADVRAYRTVGGGAPPAPSGHRGGRGVPFTVAGAAGGLTLAVLLGVPLVPALAAGAVGALGGRLIDQRRGAAEVGEELVGFARHAIGVQIDAYRDLVRSDLATAFAARRSAVGGIFAELDRALAALASATGGPPGGPSGAATAATAATTATTAGGTGGTGNSTGGGTGGSASSGVGSGAAAAKDRVAELRLRLIELAN